MFEREPITAGELMDKQFLPKPVIVEGMLPAGTYILAGTPKIGKSFLMTQLCWSVAEGIPFLGLATRKSTVLYLAWKTPRSGCRAAWPECSEQTGPAPNFICCSRSISKETP